MKKFCTNSIQKLSRAILNLASSRCGVKVIRWLFPSSFAACNIFHSLQANCPGRCLKVLPSPTSWVHQCNQDYTFTASASDISGPQCRVPPATCLALLILLNCQESFYISFSSGSFMILQTDPGAQGFQVQLPTLDGVWPPRNICIAFMLFLRSRIFLKNFLFTSWNLSLLRAFSFSSVWS